MSIYGPALAAIGRTSVARDGSRPPETDITWNGQRITDVGEPLLPGDAVNKAFVDSNVLYGASITAEAPAPVTPVPTGTEADLLLAPLSENPPGQNVFAVNPGGSISLNAPGGPTHVYLQIRISSAQNTQIEIRVRDTLGALVTSSQTYIRRNTDGYFDYVLTIDEQSLATYTLHVATIFNNPATFSDARLTIESPRIGNQVSTNQVTALVPSSEGGINQWAVNVAHETGLQERLPLSGGAMSGPITMGGHTIKDLIAPAEPADAATKAYTDTQDNLRVAKTGDTMSGDLVMGAQRVSDLADPVAAQDAATKAYTDSQDNLRVAKAGDTMSGDLAMGGNRVTGLADPAVAQDAATKNYVDSAEQSGRARVYEAGVGGIFIPSAPPVTFVSIFSFMPPAAWIGQSVMLSFFIQLIPNGTNRYSWYLTIPTPGVSVRTDMTGEGHEWSFSGVRYASISASCVVVPTGIGAVEIGIGLDGESCTLINNATKRSIVTAQLANT